MYMYVYETIFLHHSPVEQLAIMPLGHHFPYAENWKNLNLFVF